MDELEYKSKVTLTAFVIREQASITATAYTAGFTGKRIKADMHL